MLFAVKKCLGLWGKNPLPVEVQVDMTGQAPGVCWLSCIHRTSGSASASGSAGAQESQLCYCLSSKWSVACFYHSQFSNERKNPQKQHRLVFHVVSESNHSSEVYTAVSS